MVEDVARPQVAAGLFAARREEDQGPARPAAGLRHPFPGRQHRGELGHRHALHVEHPAADHPGRLDPPLEGRHDPLLRAPHRIDVEVVVEHQRLAALAFEDRPQVRPGALLRFDLDGNARLFQDAGEVAGGIDLATGVRRRVDPHQILKAPDVLVRFVVDVLPARVEDRRRPRPPGEHDGERKGREQRSIEHDPCSQAVPRLRLRARHLRSQLSASHLTCAPHPSLRS